MMNYNYYSITDHEELLLGFRWECYFWLGKNLRQQKTDAKQSKRRKKYQKIRRIFYRFDQLFFRPMDSIIARIWKQVMIFCAWAVAKAWQFNMDGNKDEAIKCRELAEKYIREGNKEKALKFLAKSNKLYPSKEVEGMEKYLKICKSQRFQASVPVLLVVFVEMSQLAEFIF